MARRTSSDMDSLALEIARWHFEDDLPNARIASRLGIASTEIAGHLRRARRNGLFALRVEDPGTPARDLEAERFLETTAGVRRVVAVRIVQPAGDDPPGSPDRQLHQQIAAGAASFLWQGIRDHDTIAVGAGRAVRFTIDNVGRLAAHRPRRFHDVEIVSLTGTPDMRRDPHDLDSDAIASELGHILHAEGTSVRRVSASFVARNPRAAVRSGGSTLLESGWVGERRPDIAVVGLGILNHRHHLMVQRHGPRLAPVKAILDRLESDVLATFPGCILDVYDTFWVQDETLPGPLEATAQGLVEELNRRIVAMPRGKLDEAREKIVVAGGEYKYEGILAFLRQQKVIGFSATTLITDAHTARRLARDFSNDLQ